MRTELCYLSSSPPGGCLCIDCYTQRRSLVSFTRRSLTSVLFHRGRKRPFDRSPSSLSVCLAAGLEGKWNRALRRRSPPFPLSPEGCSPMAVTAAHDRCGTNITAANWEARAWEWSLSLYHLVLADHFWITKKKKIIIILQEGTAVNILKPDTMVTWDCDVEHTYYICWLSSNEPHEPITGALVN